MFIKLARDLSLSGTKFPLKMEWFGDLLRKPEFRNNSELNDNQNVYGLCDISRNVLILLSIFNIVLTLFTKWNWKFLRNRNWKFFLFILKRSVIPEQRSGNFWFKVKKSFQKSIRISGTFSTMEMEKILGSFPYVNCNPELWWKP